MINKDAKRAFVSAILVPYLICIVLSGLAWHLGRISKKNHNVCLANPPNEEYVEQDVQFEWNYDYMINKESK